MGNFVPALHGNLRAQVKFFFTAGCADRTESVDIKTTGIASLVCPLLISATFRSALTQCALVWPAAQNKKKIHKGLHDRNWSGVCPPFRCVQWCLARPNRTSRSCSRVENV